MHSLISPTDFKNKTKMENDIFQENEIDIIKKKLNVDIRKFCVDHYYVDPCQINQKIGLVSFVPSSGAKADEDGIFGMFKLRGVYANEEEANRRAKMIVEDVDSYHTIYHVNVGMPFPITNSSKFSEEIEQIDIRKKATEIISEDILKKKKKSSRDVEDMEKKEKELLRKNKKVIAGEKIDDYEEYIQNMVKRAQLIWTAKETMEKMKQMKESYNSSVQKIKDLDEQFPDFKDKYLQKYMEAREEAGIPNEENSFLKYLGLDLNVDWDKII